jgi:hypothetical protein
LFLPPDARVLAKVGDLTTAGTTVLAELPQ